MTACVTHRGPFGDAIARPGGIVELRWFDTTSDMESDGDAAVAWLLEE